MLLKAVEQGTGRESSVGILLADQEHILTTQVVMSGAATVQRYMVHGDSQESALHAQDIQQVS